VVGGPGRVVAVVVPIVGKNGTVVDVPVVVLPGGGATVSGAVVATVFGIVEAEVGEVRGTAVVVGAGTSTYAGGAGAFAVCLTAGSFRLRPATTRNVTISTSVDRRIRG